MHHPFVSLCDFADSAMIVLIIRIALTKRMTSTVSVWDEKTRRRITRLCLYQTDVTCFPAAGRRSGAPPRRRFLGGFAYAIVWSCHTTSTRSVMQPNVGTLHVRTFGCATLARGNCQTTRIPVNPGEEKTATVAARKVS